MLSILVNQYIIFTNISSIMKFHQALKLFNSHIASLSTIAGKCNYSQRHSFALNGMYLCHVISIVYSHCDIAIYIISRCR